MFYNVSFLSLVFWTYVIFDENVSKKRKKENKEGKDSNEAVSKNQRLKWNVTKYRDQNENTP